jgi:integrase/recombinase XerD
MSGQVMDKEPMLSFPNPAKHVDSRAGWVRHFLIEHLIAERNLAANTQRSYRDAFCQLMPFVSSEVGKPVDKLDVEDVSSDRVRLFLTHVEDQRRCTVRTRNQRLAAIHAFARFFAERSPQHIAWCASVRTVPFKRFDRTGLCYLDKPEIEALIEEPDCGRAIGRRDNALLMLLYNTGARASEAAFVAIQDIQAHPDGTGSVKLTGKGAKTRHCPLWPTTLTKLQALTENRALSDRLFINQRGQSLTRFGILAIVRRHVGTASSKLESLKNKRIGPHTIRHTTATHLLRAGLDINTIRAWLGHVSVDTTNSYAEIDLETKRKMAVGADEQEAPNELEASLQRFRDEESEA